MSQEFVAIDPQAQGILTQAAKTFGKSKEREFEQNAWQKMQDLRIVSPIEQILYASLLLVIENSGTSKYSDYLFGDDEKKYELGVDVELQVEIGRYRVDFLVTNYEYSKSPPQTTKSVVVECDSQQWHERTEQERRYEKARDRYLMKTGLKIFHFTGAEIMANPIKVACEVVAFVVNYEEANLLEVVTEILEEFESIA